MKKVVEFLTPSETREFARILGERLKKPLSILFFGELGAGKTFFIRGLAEGLGTKDRVKSPSFTILYIYKADKMPIYHFDLYRLDQNGILDLFKEGYFDREGIVLIEWAEKLPSYEYFSPFLKIEIFITGENSRKFVFSSDSLEIEKLINEVINEYTWN